MRPGFSSVRALRATLAVGVALSAAAPAPLSGLDWPVESRIVSGTFGEDRGDHFHNGVDIGGGGQDVHPVLPGELIFRYDEATDFSSLPRGTGSFVAVRHAQGIVTIYGHLQDGSLGPERDRLQPGDRIGIAGDSGKVSGPQLLFSLFDEEAGLTVNPLQLLPPLTRHQAPVIRRVLAAQGERRVVLDNGAVLPPGPTLILAEAYDLREDVRFSWPMAPASIVVSLDGREVSRISFESLQVEQGRAVLSGSRLSRDQVYDAEGLTICGTVDLRPGASRLTVLVRSFGGAEAVRQILFSVRP